MSKKADLFHWTLGVALAGSLMAGCASMGQWPEKETAAYNTFETRCKQCHGLPHPGRHTPEEWDGMLGLMARIMNERNVSYTKEEMSTIRQYLHRNAR